MRRPRSFLAGGMVLFAVALGLGVLLHLLGRDIASGCDGGQPAALATCMFVSQVLRAAWYVVGIAGLASALFIVVGALTSTMTLSGSDDHWG